MTFEYPSQLLEMIEIALSKLENKPRDNTPYMAERLSDWIGSLAADAKPITYFSHSSAFPTLLFPWWLEKSIAEKIDIDFQTDLVYSSVCGYYFIRLIDNVMDESGHCERNLLPILAYLHSQFQSVPFRYFEYNHGFWEYFDRQWSKSAEASLQDSELDEINEAAFIHIASKKVCAGKIPMMAVIMKSGHKSLPANWERLFDLMSCWHQMYNDLLDWKRDLEIDNITWFLTEAKNRTHPNETILSWVMKEGFEWGAGRLKNWMKEMDRLAVAIGNKDLETYITFRDAYFDEKVNNVLDGFQQINKLMDLTQQ